MSKRRKTLERLESAARRLKAVDIDIVRLTGTVNRLKKEQEELEDEIIKLSYSLGGKE